MREELLSILRCPFCSEGVMVLEDGSMNGPEVREGTISCSECGRGSPIIDGIVDLLVAPTLEVMQEIKAWDAMRPAPPASEEQHMCSREWLLALPMLEGKEGPRVELETWRRHGRAVFDLCAGAALRGRRVLELGAGRCWLSAYLAREGAEVVAADILDNDDIGLGCAEAFLEDGVFFERVLCDMQKLPFAAASFDTVVATATLHHSPEPRRLFEEIARVLKPSGRLLAANEPLYVPWREAPEEKKKGAHESSYPLWTWLRYLRGAGLWVEEVRVGRDASLHLKASLSTQAGSPHLREISTAALNYAAVLALALPRLVLIKVRDLKAGRPMRRPPRGRIRYLRARLGLSTIGTQALAREEDNWGPGWYPPEGDVEPFRWCGPRSRFLLPSRKDPKRLVMELATFHPSPQAAPVELEVRIGRKKVGIIRIDRHGWERFMLRAPGARARIPVPVTIRVRRGYFVPREMGLGDDRRLLGVACRGAWWE
jgi:SAM-dependent methyltransferase/uncharacterized protein YbaR (Trm112 family)